MKIQILFACALIDVLSCSPEVCKIENEYCSNSIQPTSHLIRSLQVTSLQLAGYNTDCGRVELKLRDGEDWLAVCSEDWSMKEAKVICRQLGFRECSLKS